ncbi:phosphoesterase family-domain-containing protein [Mycena metata]|uniref:Phosphoesterase family-domain-containing protein n=1 Tax=Mycena metata TaxID=1033252 RepID=A0AAD7NJT8_9AGAR|nr:phosphoesterase family-domain-containing protein [Mycena metata]
MTAALLAAIFCSIRLADAASAQSFVPPSKGPLVQTANYTSFSNDTLNDTTIVKGKVFDRIIQIWLENTDFETAASTSVFEAIAKQGVLFTNYNAVTHPSEPNYVAAIGGDFFGMADDDMYHVPANISCVVDLLEDKNISWATYQENMPTDAFYGMIYKAPNYASPSSQPYPYYVRKHNPLMIFDAVSQDSSRINRIRTFNDFANDAVNGTLPQWVFVTPNMVNDAHDTTIDFAASFLEYWLLPLIIDPRVNSENTLILLTFDETESYGIQNRIYTVALGGAVPENLHGTEDDTLYTHYSSLSTVQSNWDLKSLGRQDTNPAVSNVFAFVAEQTGFQNTQVPVDHIPQFNLTGVASGALTSANFVPFAAPNLDASGAGSGGVFRRPGLDMTITDDNLPPPVDLSALDTATPWQMSPRTSSGSMIIPCGNAACA